MPYEYEGLKISWLGHDSFLILHEDKRIYFDPYKIESKGEATHVFISHEHFDHLSLDDLKKIVGDRTNIIAAEPCSRSLRSLGRGILKYVRPGDEFEVDDVKVKVIPAYNITKFREPGVVYHPKNAGGVGYVVEVGGVKIYHAGDTDFIPEMKELRVDIALVPVSGTFVMTAEEAARAVNEFRPKLAIPMHYGAIIGSVKDAEEFREKAEVEVVILEKE